MSQREQYNQLIKQERRQQENTGRDCGLYGVDLISGTCLFPSLTFVDHPPFGLFVETSPKTGLIPRLQRIPKPKIRAEGSL